MSKKSSKKSSEPKIYLLRHKPSGLFYSGGVTGMSTKGKIYSRKPSMKYMGRTLGVSSKLIGEATAQYAKDEFQCKSYARSYGDRVIVPVVPEEWEIVRFEMVEVEVIPCSAKA